MSEITLYNTLTRTIDTFTPQKVGEVSIYSCGPTVYHYAHIGNLRAYIVADTLRRMFLYHGYHIRHVINITDVGHMTSDGDTGEDKLEKGARREGKSVWDVAAYYTEAFMNDLVLLNIPQESYIFPRATDHIKEQIELIQTLEAKGHTYTISDGVYFDTSTFTHYPDLAKLDIEGLKSGARIEENKEKKNITDFALWKFSNKEEKRQMEWDSPWGVGYPGWHIECSAMSQKYLGNHFDIHTGGIDHIPVHHTNEIAQSECAHGERYVNYWLHINFLNDKTGKMSKSNDDFLRLEKLLSLGYLAPAYRYFILTTHYRKEINFSYESLDAATVAYKKLYNFCAKHVGHTGKINDTYAKKYKEFISSDLGTPECIALIWELIKDETVSEEDKYTTILSFDEILGLDLQNAHKEDIHVSQEVQELLEKRKQARENKDWQMADTLRDQIHDHGFLVKDGKDGQELESL